MLGFFFWLCVQITVGTIKLKSAVRCPDSLKQDRAQLDPVRDVRVSYKSVHPGKFISSVIKA